MTTFQIIGLIVVALLGLYVFYCIYDLEKFNKKKDRRKKNKVLSLALLFFAIVADKSVSAQNSWTVSASNSGTKTTFAIRRSGDLSIQETVYYRTVNLSAVDGKNYTSATGSKTFGPGDYEKTVEITETPSNNVEEAYHFQTTTDRTYRFEVLDEGGFELAHADRTISYDGDYRHTATYVNKSITDLAYFDNDGNLCSGINSSKYMEVCHSGSQNTWIQVTDAGYSQGVYSMSTNNLFHNSSALRTYLSNRSNKMYATVIFSQKEEQDGYQYIQILANNASTYDGNDPNGAVNDPSTSLYKACFILSYANSGSVITTAHQQFFPHRYAYVDKATERKAGLTHYEFDSGDSHLYQQKYRLPAFNADNTGSLNLPMTTQTINVRFDAAGSGGDNWDFINLRIRLALLDATAPTLLNNYQVSGGRHSKGNPIYISIAFKEIVTYTGGNNRKINTTWGDFAYCAGEGTNVLTFKGNISATATSALSVTGYQGTIKDLAGNQFNGTISKYFGTALQDNYNYSISYDLAGGTLATPNPTSYNYETATFMLNNPTKSHYTFTGWTGNNITVPSSSVTVYNHSHGNRHYHAFYSPTEYNIAYDLGGGEIPGGQSNPATYTIETPSFTLVNPTRAGYTFDGWTGTGISEPTQTATIAQGSVNDRSYTAHWMLDTWTGTGTPDDPFIIVNAGQLEMLATRVNSGSGDDYASLGYSGKYFKLGNDIDMSGIANFTPIGTSGRHFKGNFDGNGKTIGNLTIDRLGVEYVGLFGYLDQCTIQNLILDNANVTGGMCTGCVVGEYYHSSIINCLVKNSAVTANSSNSGVIAGYVSFTDPMGSTSNYYHNCSRTHNDATTNVNIGVNNSDQYWARSVHGLTLPTNVTANGESVVIGESNYFASNTTVTLSYNNLPAGYVVNYSYNDGTSHSLDGNAFTMPAADASVSVNVVEAIYSITYNLDGGTVSNINPYTYTVNTPTFSLNNPIKPGYVFDGWIGTDHTEATMTLSIVQGSTGDREYTATWSVYVEPCSVVTFPWSEDFSTYEIGEFHDDCWLNEHISGEGAFLFDVYNDQDGMQLRLQNIPTASQTMLRLPKMVFANDNYELLIDVYRDLVEGNDGFRIYASIDGAIEGATELAFISRSYTTSDGGLIPAESTSG